MKQGYYLVKQIYYTISLSNNVELIIYIYK